LLVGLILLAAATSGGCRSNDDDPLASQINYPFIAETAPIGINGRRDPFIMRTAVGNTEYTVEIPYNAKDYDIQVPLTNLDLSGPDGRAKKVSNPAVTDREYERAMPKLDDTQGPDASVVDAAFGVGRSEGPEQSPSYSMGVAKVNDFFKKRDFEYALIEINNLLAFYPTSPKLHKMKGTVHVRMRNLQLAELAWIRALDLDPTDTSLRKALGRLQQRIAQNERTLRSASGQDGAVSPQPVGTRPTDPLQAPFTH